MRLTIIAAGTSNNDLIFAAGFFSGIGINNYSCKNFGDNTWKPKIDIH
jgi:hypothetical protein